MTSRVAHKIRLAGGAVGVLVGICSLLTMPVAALEQGGLGGKPAHPKTDNSRSQSIFVHSLDPGEQVRDGVEIINNTNTAKRVLVYAVDSQISSGGAFACAQRADKPISVGTWVAMDRTEVTLGPKTKQEVSFTVKAPKDAAPGEHNGCIVIQDTEQHTTSDSNGIVLSLRSAIRLVITIPGDIKKGLAFTGLAIQAKDDDKLLLSTALKNNGNVSLDTKLEVALTHLIGLSASKAGGSFPVLSGNEGRFNFEISRPFWGGWYRLTATAQYNDKVEAAIGEGLPNASIRKSRVIFITPQPAAAAIEGALLVAIAGTAFFLIRRRLATRQATVSARKYIVGAHENLHTIAEKAGVSWKVLARINKLRPPYQLKPGQVLIVPARPSGSQKQATARRSAR